jgi:hypothetical protein
MAALLDPPIAIDNDRTVPQQALSSLTTVDDIETHIHLKEKEAGKQYLQVADLPMRERDHTIRELLLMGITQVYCPWAGWCPRGA